jgi:hypothetical protein
MDQILTFAATTIMLTHISLLKAAFKEIPGNSQKNPGESLVVPA